MCFKFLLNHYFLAEKIPTFSYFFSGKFLLFPHFFDLSYYLTPCKAMATPKVRLSYVVALLYKTVLYKKGVKFCTFGSTRVTFGEQQRRNFCSWFN